MTLPEFNPLLIPAAEIPAAMAQLAAWQSQLAARLVAATPVSAATADGPDKLLTVEQAAERLGMTKDGLYRMSKTAPFVVRLGPGQLRFSSTGIDQYIHDKMSRNP
jgi:predicted DNA-binding transcriptional regulator AlpA